MRGQRATLPPRRTEVDVLITAARYDEVTGELKLAQGYEPMGYVWMDINLYSRQELVERLQSGKKLAYGGNVKLATDFQIQGELELVERAGEQLIQAEGSEKKRDDLGVPLF